MNLLLDAFVRLGRYPTPCCLPGLKALFFALMPCRVIQAAYGQILFKKKVLPFVLRRRDTRPTHIDINKGLLSVSTCNKSATFPQYLFEARGVFSILDHLKHFIITPPALDVPHSMYMSHCFCPMVILKGTIRHPQMLASLQVQQSTWPLCPH